jgi:2-polyprenyl-3-methyl-5-hydroxy-6-metoxy-1,4-benzoquinol methylase
MNKYVTRSCPICGGHSAITNFPSETIFNNIHFSYLKCIDCDSVFVDPTPDSDTFLKMYAKSTYHDYHYDGDESEDYIKSALLLRNFLKADATVLDYGCGVGGFLKALSSQALVSYGVEFDAAAAKFAALNAKCTVISVDEFSRNDLSFDAIHLGDVLEHLPNPADTLTFLLRHLKKNGILFVEGPLEVNPSLVFWSARIFAIFKRLFKPRFLSNHKPTHLFLTNAEAQLDFFKRVCKDCSIIHWDIYETGWPYSNGGFIKSTIARLAILIGRRQFAGVTLGNRFKVILLKGN